MHLAPTYPAVFEALRMRGIDVGYPKPPFRRLTAEEIQKLRDNFKKLGAL